MIDRCLLRISNEILILIWSRDRVCFAPLIIHFFPPLNSIGTVYEIDTALESAKNIASIGTEVRKIGGNISTR